MKLFEKKEKVPKEKLELDVVIDIFRNLWKVDFIRNLTTGILTLGTIGLILFLFILALANAPWLIGILILVGICYGIGKAVNEL